MDRDESTQHGTRALLAADARRFLKHSGATLTGVRAALFLISRPGYQLAALIRLQAAVYKIPLFGPVLRRIIWYFNVIYFSCDIEPTASLGPGIYFPHPIGIVIGGEWDIGEGASILQGVTLGRREAEETPMRCRIGRNCFFGAGAKVIGASSIGDNVRVGANAVVLHDVPADHTATGVPAKLNPNKQLPQKG